MSHCANVLANHWDEMLGAEIQQVNWRNVITAFHEIAD
jgi:hypothetical protein